MTPERALALIHNLDVPEDKRKFWPQWSTIVVTSGGNIEDVIQHFEWPNDVLHRRHMDIYPHSVQFTAKAGETCLTLDALLAKVQECAQLVKQR
jgi:hypothetical protein